MSGSVDDAWDNYFDKSELSRMCPCASCNFYLPPEQYKPGSECEETALIKAIVAAAVNAALTEAADAVRANRERRHVLNWPDPKSEHVEDWLRERARRTT